MFLSSCTVPHRALYRRDTALTELIARARLGSAIQNLLHANVLDAGAEADDRLDWVVVLEGVRHEAFNRMGHPMRRQ